MRIGRLVALGDDGVPWVTAAELERPRPARALIALGPGAVGREALLCFTKSGRDVVPVIVGIVQPPGGSHDEAGTHELNLTVERRRLVLTAQEEIVLRCGSATISLDAQGHVTIRGANVISTAAGTNRIRGGTVRIN
jgi:hypothetical protein